MSGIFLVQLRRELLLAYRSPQELVNPWLFFLMVSSLLPLALGAEPEVLQQWGGGMIWVMALLASLLSLDALFRSDYDDGTLDQMLVRPEGLFWPVLAKVLAHWLTTGLPLALVSPLLGLMFSLPEVVCWWLPLSLLPGTLAFSFIGAVGAALTVSIRKAGVLLSLIIMPLYIPVLIFGAGSLLRVAEGYNAAAPLAVLTALAAFSLALAPLAILAALRISVDG